MLPRFPLSNEALGPGGYLMNFWVGMCHRDPESLHGPYLIKFSSILLFFTRPNWY